MDRKIDLSRSSEEKDITPRIIPNTKEDLILQNFNDSMSVISDKFNILEEIEQLEGELKNDYSRFKEDTLRSQIVFAMSALDFYMHEIVRYYTLEIFKGNRTKTKSYKNRKILMEFVERAIKNPESIDWLEEWTREQEGKNTYMSSKKISGGISLISKKGGNLLKEIASELGYPTVDSLKEQLDDIYDKRNVIAHQANKDSANGNLESINKEYVEESIEFIKKLVNSMHQKLVQDV